MNRNILECMSIVGTNPEHFLGEKKYISTGAVDHNYIDSEAVELVTYENRPSRANLVAKKGDILFAKMKSTKKTLLLDELTAQNIYSTGFFAVKANEKIIMPELLYYLLDSEAFLIQKDKYSSGATQQAITNAGLKKITLKIPELDKQESAVEILVQLDTLIAQRKEQLELLDDLVKARFVELFGDPIRNTQNRPTTDFINIVKMQRGFDLPVQDRQQDGDIPVYGSNGALDRHNVAKVQGGGVITGRSGTIGKVYYTRGLLATKHFVVFR